ncbi:hypothetical protein RB213_008794 [Colletotrichum asianum]
MAMLPDMSKQTDARESEPTHLMDGIMATWRGTGDADAAAEVPKDAPTVVVWISDKGGGEGRDREAKAGPGKGASTSILASHPSKPVLRAIRNRWQPPFQASRPTACRNATRRRPQSTATLAK